MKKKVMQFFAVLLVFVGVLAILQYFVFGGITFFAIYNSGNIPIQQETSVQSFLNDINSAKGFSLKIGDYILLDNKLTVQYTIKELKGENQEMNLGFSLMNGEKLIEKGEQKVIVEANRENMFSITFDVGGYSNLVLLLDADNGKVVASASKEILLENSKGISGNAINDIKVEAMPWLLFIVIALTIAIVALRNVTKRQAVHYFRRSHNRGLIGLEINTP